MLYLCLTFLIYLSTFKTRKITSTKRLIYHQVDNNFQKNFKKKNKTKGVLQQKISEGCADHITDTNMQQQLMHQMQQQQHRPTSAFNTTSITTDHIQQYLDENKALILNILENQNTGKFSECAENQTRLQHNLMYLAAIADSQPKSSSIHLQQQQQQQQLQLQQMVPNSHMVAQSHTGFTQQPPFTMMQQHMLQSQLGMSSIGSSGIHTPRSGTSMEGQGAGAFPDFSFGEVGSHGIGRAATNKENRSNTSSSECLQDYPQKKGKLTTAAT